MLADITLFFCFLHDTATTEIYTLSLHDALPISNRFRKHVSAATPARKNTTTSVAVNTGGTILVVPIVTRAILPKRSEEHTSELQSRLHLVCRLLLEKKKKNNQRQHHTK